MMTGHTPYTKFVRSPLYPEKRKIPPASAKRKSALIGKLKKSKFYFKYLKNLKLSTNANPISVLMTNAAIKN